MGSDFPLGWWQNPRVSEKNWFRELSLMDLFIINASGTQQCLLRFTAYQSNSRYKHFVNNMTSTWYQKNSIISQLPVVMQVFLAGLTAVPLPAKTAGHLMRFGLDLHRLSSAGVDSAESELQEPPRERCHLKGSSYSNLRLLAQNNGGHSVAFFSITVCLYRNQLSFCLSYLISV